MRRLIWQTVTAWMLWRAHRKLRRAIPGLASIDSREAVLRSQHRSGAKVAASERKRLVTERLRAELGV